jgi:biopolymer transport protein ExbD
MARRDVPEINAGSMADIAFLLLIFFLVTTTMDVDTGLTRRLPPPAEETQDTQVDVKERNIFVVLINSNNQLMVEGKLMMIEELKDACKEFIVNPNNSENLPEKEIKDIPFFGQLEIGKGVVSLQNDRGTEYGMYIAVQDALIAAYNELRDDLSMKRFGKIFDNLPAEEQDAIKEIYPQRISEAEPKNIGGK